MISARNKIKGTIREVKEGAVNGIVKLETPKGHKVSATISMEAIRELSLKAGKEATAVIKATEVMMANDFLKISARNQFRGKITEILPGAVNAIVKLDVDAEFGLSSTISLEAVKELSLKAGEEAVAVIKATSVMISVD
ncbi:TOBE domain protein [Oribacterium sp. oral taxon 078 str. F0262]|uniref:TOBE domain-containing protein n=1 Tax=Oribacterium sp. oral taxon 078 TaxID=652706 RepID=UPI0001BCB953|nr:TOBE domain-containing protein [Oribacterium sp. oral taxon 078]EFE90913.1 TOBE domain protein [Oribacterium sp. oral taxon 078 str. F0262]